MMIGIIIKLYDIVLGYMIFCIWEWDGFRE